MSACRSYVSEAHGRNGCHSSCAGLPKSQMKPRRPRGASCSCAKRIEWPSRSGWGAWPAMDTRYWRHRSTVPSCRSTMSGR